MSLLKRPIRARTAIHWVFALLATSLMGCMLFETLGPPANTFVFSHRVHVVDQGLECASCHRRWDQADDPGMPTAAQCALCHVELDAEKPPERQVASLFEDKQYKSSRVTGLAEELQFSHLGHATRATDCATCHAEIVAIGVPKPEPAWTMDGCMNCHAANQASNECAVCHTQIRAEVAPPNHGIAWKREHGQIVRECRRETSFRCELCHSDSSCTQCHQTEMPESHNNFWHRRGHGLAASRDRESCFTCHPASTCDACHRESEPISHSAGFGSPSNRHCMGCHQPLGNESCVVCHKGTPSHALAPPKPPGHTPAMNCRMCHGNGQPLPHFDNGDDCNSCHH